MLNLTNACIDLGYKYLQDDHMLELSNQLKKMPNQNWALNLEYNRQISPDEYRYLADSLSSTITIVDLCVSSNDMNEEALTNLLNNLWKNKSLKNFNLILL